jgi:type II secretory pathway pseudopilin PulG
MADDPTAATRRGPRVSFMEAIVVLSIFALLAGVVSPLLGSALEDGRRERAAQDCKAIADALAAYHRDHGDYPPGVQEDATYSYANGAYFGFGAEVLNRWLAEGAKRYLPAPIAADPWGQPYNYHVYSRSEPYMDVVVFSNGPNGQCESWDGHLWNRGRLAGDDVGAFFDGRH